MSTSSTCAVTDIQSSVIEKYLLKNDINRNVLILQCNDVSYSCIFFDFENATYQKSVNFLAKYKNNVIL